METPRSIRLYDPPDRVKLPHYVMWRVDGKQKTKAFKSQEKQIDFAKSLFGDVKKVGLDAFRLNEGEARSWRAFRLLIGDAPLMLRQRAG